MKHFVLLALLFCTSINTDAAYTDAETKIDKSAKPHMARWLSTDLLQYNPGRLERTYDETNSCIATTTDTLIKQPSIIVLNHAKNDDRQSIQSLYNANVSAHYLISRSGAIYYLLPSDGSTKPYTDTDCDECRAFHAGHARWKVRPGATTGQDVNSLSLGVILANDGPQATPRTEYTTEQMNALKALLTYKMQQYAIKPSNIIAHGECAIDPTTLLVNRKQGPGHHFPWEQLNEEGICYGHGLDESALDAANDMGEVMLHACLETIGYFLPREPKSAEESESMKLATTCVIEQFNRRYDRKNFEDLCASGMQGAITNRVKNMAQAVAAKVKQESYITTD